MEKSNKTINQMAIGIGLVGILSGIVLFLIGSEATSAWFAIFNGVCLAGVGFFNLKE